MVDTQKPVTLQATGENPVIKTQLLLPADSLYRHAPAVLVSVDGGRVYLLRAGEEAQDRAELLAWEGTRGGFSVPAGVDGGFYVMPKGDATNAS
jgi:hypothetical protein